MKVMVKLSNHHACHLKEHFYSDLVTVIKQIPGKGDGDEATFCRHELSVIKPKLLMIENTELP